MNFSDKASKLILSAALFTLAGSIVFVSGTGLAQGATSTDKAISTLKSQIKSLQARVQTLEDSPELLQGEPGEQGAQGPQGATGATGAKGSDGAPGTLVGLKTKKIDYLSGRQFECGSYDGSSATVLGSAELKWSRYRDTSSTVIGFDTTNKVLSGCSITIYTP